jgi:hypothetical protein
LNMDSITTRFRGNKPSAEGIIGQLIARKKYIVLRLQKELVDEKKNHQVRLQQDHC